MIFDFHRYRYALVTSTTYAAWLPGDEKGFVSEVNGEIHNQYGTPFDRNMPNVKIHSQQKMTAPPVIFTKEQAEMMITQWIKDTQRYGWHLFNAAVMASHFHLLTAVPADEEKKDLLRSFKARASFALNKRFGKQHWWTESGSVRYSFNESAFYARREYVKNQEHILAYYENTEDFNGLVIKSE